MALMTISSIVRSSQWMTSLHVSTGVKVGHPRCYICANTFDRTLC